MSLWKYERDSDGYMSREPLDGYTSELREKAKQKYTLLKEKGVILSDYSDSKWKLTKQTRHTHINFSKNEQELRLLCTQSNESYESFIDALKCFVLLRLGTCQLENMTTLVSTVISETIKSKYYTQLYPLDNVMLTTAVDYTDFVKLIAPTRIEYHDVCENSIDVIRYSRAEISRQYDHPCALSEFDSVFVYNEIMRAWRSSETDQKKLAYFFPLYLFWIITTVLPLRVSEFCFTPFDCIRKSGNRFFLTIRRSKLKGNHQFLPKFHDYTLEKDYVLNTYEIPEQIFREIEAYREWSRDYHRNHSLLFSLEFMYENDVFQRKEKFSKSSVFDSYYLGWLQKQFYQHVIIKLYGYSLVSSEDLEARSNHEGASYKLNDNEIMMIRPKETRHLALINLILRGCNPVMIKEFAGHANESMSAHYYSNSSNLTRTAVVRLHELQLHHENVLRYRIVPAMAQLSKSNQYIEMDHGKCYSPNFQTGNISDCSNCGGDCQNCQWCIPNSKDSYTELESVVDDELEYISKLLKNPEIDSALTQVVLQRYYKLETNLASRILQEIKYEQKQDIL